VRYATGTSVGERGQITIERELRERLGVKPKDIAIQRIEDGRLVVEFVRPHEPHTRSLVGMLGPPATTGSTAADVDDAVGQGIAEEWRSYLEQEVVPRRRATSGRKPRPQSP